MIFDLRNFLHSLAVNAKVVAEQRDPTLAISYRTNDPSPRNLWRMKSPEDDPRTQPNSRVCADPYSVLRIYGGQGSLRNPKPIASVQLKTIGSNDDAAWGLAVVLYEAIALDQNGAPTRMRSIDGFTFDTDAPFGEYMIVNVDTIGGGRPGQIGRDERGRVILVSNFEVGFYIAGVSSPTQRVQNVFFIPPGSPPPGP